MQVTAKFVNPPKEGKKYGNIKGQDDTAYWFKRDAFSFEKGKTYDLSLKTEKWGENSVQVITAVAPVGATAPGNGGEHDGLTEPELRFISNVVGTAIESKTITSPEEISLWAKAARATLRELA